MDFLLVNTREGTRSHMCRFPQPTGHDGLKTAIVEAFQREGIPVIFAERNDRTTVVVVETGVQNWSDVAINARLAFNSSLME